MRGGVKVYRGAAAAARNYLEAYRSRADDYYLAEGSGIARRFTAGPNGPVGELPALVGDAYEAWVAGSDPATGEPRGRVRPDAAAVRFVEVVVNGPKCWSLAAELHPDLAVAYEAAQDRAAQQIIGWLAAHATTRVGPRGAQIAVPVDRLEAVTVRHYTSRAGDPHRHLHLQVNARVFAAGKWRGLDTVATRDSIGAINGIGHAAVTCDPAFRAALAAHGYTLTADGEIAQLAEYVGAFSKRAAQIGRLIDRYEADWRHAHPGTEPGPGLRRGWDARAWAQDRPDKVIPRSGEELRQRWLDELAGLGYRDGARPVQLALQLPGHLDRDAAAVEVVAWLGAARSGWNAADVRGQVEVLLARAGVVAEATVRSELAEDLTARALDRCVPLRDQSVPEHVRALTSRHVLDVEADLVARLAVRGADAVTAAEPASVGGLDAGQRAAVTALTGTAALVVIEGAAGAGKTTTLATARDALAEQGRRMMVVTPTLKAAHAASVEVRVRAGSAAWLVWQHGFRWNETGIWTREPAHPAPHAVLHRGDLLLVDVAGMLDQDTARALLVIADEAAARLALVGDRHQLPAIGRGGALELARRWVDPAGCVELTVVHRFTRETITADGPPTGVPDPAYGALTLRMRDGHDPADVFDDLHARGLVRLHECDLDRQQAMADEVARARDAAQTVAVVVDTREQAAALNAAIRARLIADGLVDGQHTAHGQDGQPVGMDDLVATRRNDHDLDVANRDTWTVTDVHRDGALTVTSPKRGSRVLPAEYVREHVELAYATTAHGAQGATVSTAHLALGEHTTAASAYVAMTRGRQANTVHLVAGDLDDAREQWVSAFCRDRADLGPGHAAARAAREAAGYTPARPLGQVLTELRAAWSEQAERQRDLHRATAARERLAEVIALRHQRDEAVTVLETRAEQSKALAERTRAAADHSAAAITEHAQQIRQQLVQQWNEQNEQAYDAARAVLAGPGRFGHHLLAVNRATETLARWSLTWQPYLPDMPTRTAAIARYATWPGNPQRITDVLDAHARAQAERARPEHHNLQHAAEKAEQRWRETARELFDLRSHYDARLVGYGAFGYARNPDRLLDELTEQITESRTRLDRVNRRLERLAHEPALADQPPGWLETQHQRWQADDAADTAALRRIADARSMLSADAAGHDRAARYDAFQHQLDRNGPSLAR